MSEVVKDTGLCEDIIENEWNVIRYHNKLSYLKDKSKWQNEGK